MKKIIKKTTLNIIKNNVVKLNPNIKYKTKKFIRLMVSTKKY